MKKITGKTTCLIPALLLAFSITIIPIQGYSTPPTTPTPSPSVATNGSCDAPCKAYSADYNATQAQAQISCGASPTPGSPGGSVMNNGTTYSNYGQCYSALFVGLDSRWGQLGQKCSAMKLASEARWFDLASAIAYTAAGATCGAALAAWTVPPAAANPLLPTLLSACTVSGLAGTGAEMASLIKLRMEGANAVSGYEWGQQQGLGASATLVGGAATIASAYFRLTLETQRAAGASSTPPTLIASIVMFTASASIKWANFGLNQKNSDDLCSDIRNLNAIGSGVINDPNPGPSNINFGNVGLSGGSSSGTTTSGKTSSSALTAADINQMTSASQTSFPGGMMSAAMAGPAGSVLQTMPNRDQIPEALEKLGTSLNDIGKRLAAGESPNSIIGSALPEDNRDSVMEGLKKIDEDLQSGRLSIPGASETTFAGGGGGGRKSGGPSSPTTLTYGGHHDSSSAAGKELVFEKSVPATRNLASLSGDDIWHSEWKGSIFEIVSHKLDNTRDRVEKMDWITPLNRALMGLSNQPKTPAQPGLSKGTVK